MNWPIDLHSLSYFEAVCDKRWLLWYCLLVCILLAVANACVQRIITVTTQCSGPAWVLFYGTGLRGPMIIIMLVYCLYSDSHVAWTLLPIWGVWTVCCMSSTPLCRFLCTNLFVYIYIVFSLNILILMVILCTTVFSYWHFPAGTLPGLGCGRTERSVATWECRAYGFHLSCQIPRGIWHPVGSLLLFVSILRCFFRLPNSSYQFILFYSIV